MAWARLDDNFHDHPKTAAVLDEELAGLAAMGLFSITLTWANRHRRRGVLGHLPPAIVRKFGRRHHTKLAGFLVREGFWHSHDHDCPRCPTAQDGYVIHDLSDYLRAGDSAQASAAAKKRWDTDRAKNDAQRDAEPHADRTEAACETDADTMRNDARVDARGTPGPSHARPVTTHPSIQPAPPSTTRPMDGIDDENLDQLARAVIRSHPGWDLAGARKNLALARDGVAAAQPWPTFVAVALDVAGNPATQTPGRFTAAAIWPPINGHTKPKPTNNCPDHPDAALRDGNCAACWANQFTPEAAAATTDDATPPSPDSGVLAMSDADRPPF